MRLHDIVIHESEAARIDAVLRRFLSDSSCSAALLIDRSGQPLAEAGTARTLDVGSIGALAAAAFSATAALAQLLGESEFSVLFHEGVKESMHVSTVDEQTILLAIFDEHTTIGMVRLFAREACASIGAALEETRKRPKLVGVLATPLTAEENSSAFGGFHLNDDHFPHAKAAKIRKAFRSAPKRSRMWRLISTLCCVSNRMRRHLRSWNCRPSILRKAQ